MIDLFHHSSLYSKITLKEKDMEWMLEDGNCSKKVVSIEDIAVVIRNVMEEKCELIIFFHLHLSNRANLFKQHQLE